MKPDYLMPSQILRYISTRPEHADKTKTYVVLGRPGPTGKTWLQQGLKHYGYNVVEISEHIYDLVTYFDSMNHYREHDDVVVIVLNSYLQRPRETE